MRLPAIIHKKYQLALVLLVLLTSTLIALVYVFNSGIDTYHPLTTKASTLQPPLPSQWPHTFEIGQSGGLGSAGPMKAINNFSFIYQYLTGGVNTGYNWENWDANADFPTYYIQDAQKNNLIPVFSYYMMLASNPGSSQGEPGGDYANLANPSTMNAYYTDLKVLFQKAGAFKPAMVVVHIEPDLWGYIEQKTSGNNASTVAAAVSSSGMSDVSGYANNAAGFAQAIVHLRDLYAPNVVLAYHMSVWGTGNDIIHSKPSDQTVVSLADQAAAFYQSLQANFDIVFTDQTDRDAGFKQVINGDPNTYFAPADYARFSLFYSTFSQITQKRIVLWQAPYGNTKMLAENNTWDHFQDTHVEYFLDDPSRQNIASYIQSGVVAILFGRGADGTTCNCDAAKDGITNPPAINGNSGTSLSADDDGGFFDQQLGIYYAQGAVSLGTVITSTPTPTQNPTMSPTSMPTHQITATPTNPAVTSTNRTYPTVTPPVVTWHSNPTTTTLPAGHITSVSPTFSHTNPTPSMFTQVTPSPSPTRQSDNIFVRLFKLIVSFWQTIFSHL